MSELKNLKNPPVLEAIVDFVFEADISTINLSKIKDFFSKKAEKIEPVTGFELKIENQTNQIPTVKKVTDSSVRYFFMSGSFVVLVKQNGITFSMLKPYQGFESFLKLVTGECNSLNFDQICKIKRVGVRYVNVFTPPVSPEYVKEYLNYMPSWPEDIKSQPIDFVSRVALPMPELEATCILTQTSSPINFNQKNAQVTVDIDLFKIFQNGIQVSEVWEQLIALKAKLNQIFFRSISRKALDLFL